MTAETIRFVAPLSTWSIEDFHNLGFISVPEDVAEQISAHELARRLELGKRRGFGSVKVNVTVGETRWSTSVFPPKGGGWFLPIKKAVMRAEGLQEGCLVEVELELL